ncbi:MAG: hypothetical protein ISS25_00025 [Nanoarchaeota archaeon]|nr:hypothetical protein [DPANN group archaeon]MBL7116205.1 hypothetical protein [Nanoarchaeota archaeon]
MAEQIIPKERRITKYGDLIIEVAWKVPKSKDKPEGVDYSFQLIHKGKRVVGVDNCTGEGHHFHFFSKKENCEFKSLFKTRILFYELVRLFEEIEYEIKKTKNKD